MFSCPSSYEELFLASGFSSANLRPMFPKHTQLQNKTLEIQVQTPMLSFVMIPFMYTSSYETFIVFALGEGVAGGGTISGLTPSSTAVPAIPTRAERMNPGLDRSMRYHSTGLTRAKVKETCKVDCHGSFRYTTC